MRFGAVPESVPCDGWLKVYVNVALMSGLTAASIIATGEPSIVIADWSAVPGGFTPFVPASMLL